MYPPPPGMKPPPLCRAGFGLMNKELSRIVKNFFVKNLSSESSRIDIAARIQRGTQGPCTPNRGDLARSVGVGSSIMYGGLVGGNVDGRSVGGSVGSVLVGVAYCVLRTENISVCCCGVGSDRVAGVGVSLGTLGLVRVDGRLCLG